MTWAENYLNKKRYDLTLIKSRTCPTSIDFEKLARLLNELHGDAGAQKIIQQMKNAHNLMKRRLTNPDTKSCSFTIPTQTLKKLKSLADGKSLSLIVASLIEDQHTRSFIQVTTDGLTKINEKKYLDEINKLKYQAKKTAKAVRANEKKRTEQLEKILLQYLIAKETIETSQCSIIPPSTEKLEEIIKKRDRAMEQLNIELTSHELLISILDDENHNNT